MAEDEFDNLLDDLADIDGVDWEQVLSTSTYTRLQPQRTGARLSPQRTPLAVVPHIQPTSPVSDYFGEDIFDAAALAEIDAIETRFTQQAQAGPSRQVPVNEVRPSHISRTHMLRPLDPRIQPGPSHRDPPLPGIAATSSHDVLKRLRSQSPSPHQPLKKGKMNALDSTDATRATTLSLLAEMEEDYTCAVCFDLLVAAHVANPCGHSFCGDCGQQWAATAKKNTCPICRTTLSRSARVIPNIALQNAVEKYTELLAKAGHSEWSVGGTSQRNWIERKQHWKELAMARQKKPPESTRGRVIDLTNVFLDPNEDDEGLDPSYDDGSGLIPVPPRRHLRRPFVRARSVRTGPLFP